ncbi:MAG: hypothetical protein RLZZ474_853 [Bacteroidota bacterium]
MSYVGFEFPRGIKTWPIFWSTDKLFMTESTHLDLVWGNRSVWLYADLPAEINNKARRMRLIMCKKR